VEQLEQEERLVLQVQPGVVVVQEARGLLVSQEILVQLVLWDRQGFQVALAQPQQ
jgi:hypothetical protein